MAVNARRCEHLECPWLHADPVWELGARAVHDDAAGALQALPQEVLHVEAEACTAGARPCVAHRHPHVVGARVCKGPWLRCWQACSR